MYLVYLLYVRPPTCHDVQDTAQICVVDVEHRPDRTTDLQDKAPLPLNPMQIELLTRKSPNCCGAERRLHFERFCISAINDCGIADQVPWPSNSAAHSCLGMLSSRGPASCALMPCRLSRSGVERTSTRQHHALPAMRFRLGVANVLQQDLYQCQTYSDRSTRDPENTNGRHQAFRFARTPPTDSGSPQPASPAYPKFGSGASWRART